MDKKVAAEFSALLLEQTKELDLFLIGLKENGAERDFDEVRTMIGKIMGASYLEALYPIFVEHPDLKPEGLK